MLPSAEPSGKVNCELLTSHNWGRNWTRLAPRQQFIAHGAAGSFDDHTCYAATPLSVDGKELLYVTENGFPEIFVKKEFHCLRPTLTPPGTSTPAATARTTECRRPLGSTSATTPSRSPAALPTPSPASLTPTRRRGGTW